MAEFFTGGAPGLALFLNAGDPPLDRLADLLTVLDESGVDCVELAVPFPDSVTDGPVVRRSADRALAQGVDLPAVLDFVARTRPSLKRLRVALLADWSHSLRGLAPDDFAGRAAASGVDGVLVHGLPPRLRGRYFDAADTAGLPVVTTCYHRVSGPDVLAEAAARATAYLYLVAHYGRSGSAPAAGYAELADTVTTLRETATAPIAVGFGVRTREDVLAIHESGADAVIVGSAGVAVVERAVLQDRDVLADVDEFVRSIHPVSPVTSGSIP